MASTPTRIILFLIGLFAAGGVVAYGTGVFAPKGEEVAEPVPSGTTGNAAAPAPSADNAVPQAAETPAAPQATTDGDAAADAAPPAKPVPPSFDVLRVEGDGSVVVAGKASANTGVELVAGATVIGEAQADGGGDFAIVLDEPLEPGDYSLVLRSTAPGVVATSVETAIVSVPEEQNGQVLAMVEEPGQASRLLSVPEAEGTTAASAEEPAAAQTPAGGAEPAAEQSAAVPPAPETAQAPQASAPESPATSAEPAPVVAAAPPADAVAVPAAASASAAPSSNDPAVEAVEIEGSRVFVAGRAAPGTRLRIYADDMLLGEVTASDGGRFLVETEMNLPVGTYTIRVDAIGADGATVVARAAVPFIREPGEAVAAVAPPALPQAPVAPAGAGEGAASPTSRGGAPVQTAAEPASAARPEASSAGGSVQSAPPANSDAEAAQNRVAAASTQTAEPLQRAQGAVIIRRGDSLWRISRRAYGQGMRYSTIYLANQDQIRDPDRIWPGQIFRMPESSLDGQAADMGRLGDQATTRND